MRFFITVFILSVFLFGSVASAAGYPQRPVTIIVPYNPGGAVDFVARTLAHRLAKVLGQDFIVKNMSGASGNIGTQAVASSQPDGYTLLMSAVTSSAINTAMRPDRIHFDLKSDLVPVGLVGRVPFVLVVNNGMPVENFKEF